MKIKIEKNGNYIEVAYGEKEAGEVASHFINPNDAIDFLKKLFKHL